MDVSPGGGGIVKIDQTAPSSFPNTYDFESGTSVPLEAVPAPGYTFDNWSGDLSGTANPATIVIDCNKRITANFSQVEPNWRPTGGIVAGVIVIVGVGIWFVVRNRAP